LDSVIPMIVAGPGVIHAYNRRYGDALGAFAEALELDPNSPVVNLWSSVAYLELGQYEQALTAVERARPFQLPATEMQAVILARAGRRAEVEPLLAGLHREAGQGRREARLAVARVYAALEQTDLALHWLEKAVQDRVVATVFLGVDPCFEILRGDQRFLDLLRQIGVA
jgi:tetratricopeptide (TPR) repeat protein